MKKTIVLTMTILMLTTLMFAQQGKNRGNSQGNRQGSGYGGSSRWENEEDYGYDSGDWGQSGRNKKGSRNSGWDQMDGSGFGGSMMGYGFGRNGFNQRVVEVLDLKEEQVEKMEQIKTTYLKKKIKLNAELDSKKIDLKQALQNEDFSKAKALQKDISSIKAELSLEKISQLEEYSKILTDEQKEELEEEFGNSFRGKKGRGEKNKDKKGNK